MVAALSIGEVARRTGVAASRLRYYERMGILPGALRVSGRRRYGEEAIGHLALVQLAQQAGFKLSEIRELFGDFADPIRISGRWRAMATRKLHETESSIARLQDMRALLEEGLRCRCLTLEDCAIFTGHLAAMPSSRPAAGAVSQSRRRGHGLPARA